MAVDLAIVIVNYFSYEQTCRLIKQINTSRVDVSFQIICVDNSCNEKEADLLLAIGAQLNIITCINRSNIGYGSAINRALDNVDFKKVLVLNPDVRLEHNTILNLLKCSDSDESLGVWGAVTTDINGNEDCRHAWRQPTILRAFIWAIGAANLITMPALTESYRGCSKLSSYPVDAISGCCMLISSDVWRQLEGFDERFFLYSEEIDFCYRALQAGFQPTIVSEAKIFHAKAMLNETLNRLPVIFDSRLIFAAKHFTPFNAFIYRYCLVFGALIRAIGFACKPREKGRGLVWFKLMWLLHRNRVS